MEDLKFYRTLFFITVLILAIENHFAATRQRISVWVVAIASSVIMAYAAVAGVVEGEWSADGGNSFFLLVAGAVVLYYAFRLKKGQPSEDSMLYFKGDGALIHAGAADSVLEGNTQPLDTDSAVENLQRLHSLKERGVITAGEFSAMKQKIVGRPDFRNRSEMAIGAFYAGIISIAIWFLAPVALILGILGIRDINANPDKHGRGKAIFGIVAGAIVTCLLVLLIIINLTMDLE